MFKENYQLTKIMILKCWVSLIVNVGEIRIINGPLLTNCTLRANSWRFVIERPHIVCWEVKTTRQIPFHIPESFLPMECAVKKLFLNTKVCRFIFSREAINFRPPIHGGTRVLTHNQLNVQRCYFNKRRTCSVYIYMEWGSPPLQFPAR